MDAKPHYFRIGLFVLIALTLIIVAIILFGAGLFAKSRLRIESYFTESITGLSVGSPVEFRGVRIGQVEDIGFVGNTYKVDPNTTNGTRYASWVRVVSGLLRSKLPDPDYPGIEARLEQMVAHGLRVRVSSNLLTQQAYLEMNFLDPNRFPVPSVPWVPKYPMIPSAPGELTTIKDSIDRVLTQLQEIDAKGLAASLEKLFTSLDTTIREAQLGQISKKVRDLLQTIEQKVAALETARINAAAEQFLGSLNQAVAEANIPQLSRQVRGLLDETDRKLAALDTRQINADIERLLATLERAVAEANIPALSGEAQILMAELRQTNQYFQTLFAPPSGVTPPPNVPALVARLNEAAGNLNTLITSERPSIERVLNDLHAITDSLRELVATLERNPSQLLFGRPPRKPEVVK
jgi:paraquat-inducible protein B